MQAPTMKRSTGIQGPAGSMTRVPRLAVAAVSAAHMKSVCGLTRSTSVKKALTRVPATKPNETALAMAAA